MIAKSNRASAVVNLASKKATAYRNTRLAAKRLLQDGQKIYRAVEGIVKKKSVHAIDWERTEWLDKLVKSEKSMKEMLKIYTISDSLKRQRCSMG